MGLKKNLGKDKAVVCIPVLIWRQQGVAVHKQRSVGKGGTFIEWKKTRVNCEECGTMVEA